MKLIYICCPAASYTGGPTLAHQLCFNLNKIGLKSYMWYTCNPLKKLYIDPVHPNYKHFNNPHIFVKPKDARDVSIVALESNLSVLNSFKLAKRFVWWMSVDNYFLNMSSFFDQILIRLRLHKSSIEYCSQYENLDKYSVYKEKDVTHLVQSEYARIFLKSRGINHTCIKDLGDYLEDELLSVDNSLEECRSDNVVLYNPKKGFEFTSKIIESAPQLEWIPLINMNKSEVKKKLFGSKLYIDFGNHPGRDRFPREAAICGCCVITGKRGSAGNEIDINIPQKYKFDDTIESVPDIVNRIHAILSEYEKCKHDFDQYRFQIRSEKAIFEKQVKTIFST